MKYHIEALKAQILTELQSYGKPVSSSELMTWLSVPPQDQRLFDISIGQLNNEEKIFVSKQKMIRLNEHPTSKKAVITSQSKGFAFARPDDGSPDVFIHFSKLGDAMIRDTVLLRDIVTDDRGVSGRVDKILERGDRNTTGKVEKNEGYLEFVADIPIRYGVQIDRSTMKGIHEGDKVAAKLDKNPRNGRLIAKITKVFGKSDSAKICANAILEQHDIRGKFPKAVLEEAERVAKEPITEEERAKRADFTNLPILTIDSADAKDLDDAVCVEKTPEGYTLGVHIADVSHYVREGSLLDEEAMRRGTSVYLPDRVVPMLPTALSNDACSLNAGEEKRAFSATVYLNHHGDIVDYNFKKSIIVSKVRGVYSEVTSIFEGTAAPEVIAKYEPVMDSLLAARELATLLKKKSRQNGTMEIESNESKFILDENGVCIDVQPRTTGEAEELIEQLMITANQAAAKMGEKYDIPFVYRVHEKPDPERIQILCDLLSALKLNFGGLRKENPKTGEFATVMDQAKDTPLHKIVSLQVLRTMEKARYATDPKGHFGLALQDYSHFTSPIRRYPDTCIHRILSTLCETENVKYCKEHYTAYAAKVARDCSRLEVAAMTAERSADDVFMAEFMRRHIGEEFDGVICGVTARGVFVELESSAEGFVPVDTFEDANFVFDGMLTQTDEASKLTMTIGQPIRIKVIGSDVSTGRIDFVPATGTLASLGAPIQA